MPIIDLRMIVEHRNGHHSQTGSEEMLANRGQTAMHKAVHLGFYDITGRHLQRFYGHVRDSTFQVLGENQLNGVKKGKLLG